jgi:hypothetical protein
MYYLLEKNGEIYHTGSKNYLEKALEKGFRLIDKIKGENVSFKISGTIPKYVYREE